MSAERSLSGRWLGRYDYPRARAPVGFEAELVDVEGVLTGSIREPNSFRSDMGPELSAELIGSHAAGEVHFVKHYIGFSQGSHPTYQGQANAALTRISGTWAFADPRFGSGRFVMWRKPVAQARVERAETVTAP